MLDGNMSDGKKCIKKRIYISCSKSATKYVILPLGYTSPEKRLFIGSHFEKLQVWSVLLIKEPFNHVNLKCIFNSRGSFDIVRLY